MARKPITNTIHMDQMTPGEAADLLERAESATLSAGPLESLSIPTKAHRLVARVIRLCGVANRGYHSHRCRLGIARVRASCGGWSLKAGLTREQTEEARRRVKAGESLRSVGRAFNREHVTIRRTIERLNDEEKTEAQTK